MDFSVYLQNLRQLHKRHGKPFKVKAGAQQGGLAELEAETGFPLDEHLRNAWLIADGSERDTPILVRPEVFTSYGFLSTDDTRKMVAHWRRRTVYGYDTYEDPAPRDHRIKAGWFNKCWLPFADFGNGTLLMLQDYDPAPLGQKGQIIAFTHDPDQMTYIAPDFPTFLDMGWAWIHDDSEFQEEFIEQGFW